MSQMKNLFIFKKILILIFITLSSSSLNLQTFVIRYVSIYFFFICIFVIFIIVLFIFKNYFRTMLFMIRNDLMHLYNFNFLSRKIVILEFEFDNFFLEKINILFYLSWAIIVIFQLCNDSLRIVFIFVWKNKCRVI